MTQLTGSRTQSLSGHRRGDALSSDVAGAALPALPPIQARTCAPNPALLRRAVFTCCYLNIFAKLILFNLTYLHPKQ